MARLFTKRYADGHQKSLLTHLGRLIELPQGVVNQRRTFVRRAVPRPQPLPSHKARVRQATRWATGAPGFVSAFMQAITRAAAERLVQNKKRKFVIFPKRRQ